MTVGTIALACLWLSLGQTPATEVTHTGQRNLKIPINVSQGAQRAEISEIRLFASSDQGRSFQQVGAITPDKDGFAFYAPRDGTYWLRVAMVNRQGRQEPENVSAGQPDQIMVIDTQKPIIRTFEAKPQGDEVVVGWDIQEDNPDGASFRVEYQPKNGTAWTPVAVGRPALAGQDKFRPTVGGPLTVRLTLRDQAGNQSLAFAEVNGGTALAAAGFSNPGFPTNSSANAPAPLPTEIPVPTPTFGTGPAAPAFSTAAREASLPPPLNPGTAPDLPGRISIPTQPAPVQQSAPPQAAPVQQPAPMQTAPVLAAPMVAQAAPPMPPTAPNTTTLTTALSSPIQSATPPAVGQVPPGVLPASATPAGTPSPADPNTPAAPAERVIADAQWQAMPPSAKPAPVPQPEPAGDQPSVTISARRALPPLQYVNKPEVTLEFELSKVGPSGVKSIHLWCTNDDGMTWPKDEYAFDKKTSNLTPNTRQRRTVPLAQKGVVKEGIYGFQIRVKSRSELISPAPQAGDQPEIRVELDTTPPKAILYAPSGDRQRPNTLLLKWKAEDKNLGPTPVTLEWSEQRGADWKPIASDIANEGAYAWSLPEKMPVQVFLRLKVRDLAGNESIAATREPEYVDLTEPEGHLVNVSFPPRGAKE